MNTIFSFTESCQRVTMKHNLKNKHKFDKYEILLCLHVSVQAVPVSLDLLLLGFIFFVFQVKNVFSSFIMPVTWDFTVEINYLSPILIGKSRLWVIRS